MMKGKPLVCIDCETDILKFGLRGGQELTYGKTYYVIETYHIRFYTLINEIEMLMLEYATEINFALTEQEIRDIKIVSLL